MLSNSSKKIFYLFASPAMKINGWIYKRFRVPKTGTGKILRLHLGPGQKKYISGWINIDANMFTGKCDLWADLRNPLPFRDETVDAVYSHHMIEHLPDVEAHLKDVYRILKSGGVYRVGGPNGDVAIQKFLEGDYNWFGDWPDKYESMGGRLVNFLLCRNEHLTILTESLLREMGQRAGFSKAEKLLPVKETRCDELFSDCLPTEHEKNFDAPRTLIMEFVK
ncbi:MAG TPA: methyltransferase domain-containing protein [Rhizobiales bacterium]|nr:methyltransferase domain-containing protein [Hyphomicrobiales bacterium]